MTWDDDYQRAGMRTRQLMILVVVIFTLLTAMVSVSLHYYFSRKLALDSATERYRLTATATRDYLANIDAKAMETVRVLSRFPSLVKDDPQRGPWADPATLALFAEVMRTTPLFYALYLGFDDGDVYELVNLNCSEAVRRQLNATPTDRWVVIRVEGSGSNRQRTFDYLSADFSLNFSRSEPSDYDARQRLWYTTAVDGEARKTPPYLFQHLQAPGQSFVMKLPGTDHVLALDITFSTLASHLRAQSLSAEGELFLYQRNGELLASNLRSDDSMRLPPVEHLPLTDEQRQYIRSLGSVRASNETDWTPVDFAVGGQPQGFSVDMLRLVAQMTGLSLEFVNGYRWPDLVSQYESGSIELLQPVMAPNPVPGHLSRPLLQLPYALVTREDSPAPQQMEDLNGKTLVIPEGWTVLTLVQQQYPQIHFRAVANTRAALLAVQKGEADATLDMALIMEQGLSQYYLKGLRLTRDLPGLKALPQSLHIRVRPELEPLAAIIDQALAAIPPDAMQFLRDKWFRTDRKQNRDRLPVVPYEHLLKLPEQPGKLNLVTPVQLHGETWFSFASVFTREQNPPEYFALVIPAAQVYARALNDLWVSVLIIAIVWLLVLPPVLIWLVVKPMARLNRRRHGG